MTRPGDLISTLAGALRNENVRRVELAWGAVIAAEWAHFVAFGVYAYDHGGTKAVGVAGLVRLLPAAIIAPFAASFGDRVRRERLLLVLALIGAAALGGSAAAYFAGSRTLVFVSAAFVGVVSTLVRPALQALLPSLAHTAEELIAANGATSTIESVGTLVGPLLAGVLVSVADVGAVFAVAAVALLAAAVLLARVRVEGRLDIGPADVRGLVSAGLRSVWHASDARLLVGMVAAQTFIRGCLNVLIVVAAFQVLDAGAGTVGYMTAAIGVGGLLGAVGAMSLRSGHLAVSFGIALVFWGVPIVLLAPKPELLGALALLAAVGAANSVEDVAVFTLLQRIVPNEVLAGVLGVLWGLAMGAVAVGSVTAPALVAWLGPRGAFVAVGAVLPVLAVAVYRRLVVIDRESAPAPELELIELVPMLAPLSVAAKERVASSLERRVFQPGEIVIRAGDVGERFYVVGDGRLDVDAGGRHSTLGRGDSFGEIALLRNVPRTATVTAVAESELYGLSREHFLATVTGHPVARALGETVAASRLEQSATPTAAPLP